MLTFATPERELGRPVVCVCMDACKRGMLRSGVIPAAFLRTLLLAAVATPTTARVRHPSTTITECNFRACELTLHAWPKAKPSVMSESCSLSASCSCFQHITVFSRVEPTLLANAVASTPRQVSFAVVLLGQAFLNQAEQHKLHATV
jgi:hypothetical protein